MPKNYNISIEAIKKGNKEAYKNAYIEYYDMLLGLSIQYLKDRASSEEIVQEAFLKFWENRESLKSSTNIKNYLYTIVKNLCISTLRKKISNSIYISESEYLELQANYNAINQLNTSSLEYDELQHRIADIINSLPNDVKTVFEMSRNEEFKYAEIAEKLNISVKTVEARMSKALSILRKELREYLIPSFLLLSYIM